MATIDTIEPVKTADDYEAEMLADLADPAVVTTPIPTTSWHSGSVPLALIAAQSVASADVHDSLIAVSKGGFSSTAEGDWLTLNAAEVYQNTRTAPVATIGVAKLTDSGGGPHVIAAGSLIASDGVSGHQYRNITGGTLALSGTLHLRWQALETGAEYNVGVGSVSTLVTGLAGVSIANSATWINIPGTAAGKATGTLSVSDGASSGPHVFGVGGIVVNDGAGHTYTNTSSLTLLNGATAQVTIEAAAVGIAYNVANGTITTVASATNTAGAPVAGITCTNTATDWITTAGADEESDASLRTRNVDKWGTRGKGGWNSAALRTLAKEAATSTPVTRAKTTSNPGGVAGTVIVTIGSVAGVMSAADVAIVQAYFDDDLTSLCSILTVQSCTSLTINVTGTVKVPAGYASQAQADAEANLVALNQTLDIGGNDLIGNVLPLEDIIAAIKNAVYVDGVNTNPASPLDIDLTAPTGDTAIGAYEVVNIVYSALVWQGV